MNANDKLIMKANVRFMLKSKQRTGKGFLVKTKTGKKGRTFHSDVLVNGKQLVYLSLSQKKYNETGMLCDPTTLEVIGFID